MATTIQTFLCPSDGSAPRGKTAGTNYRANNGTERWYISHNGPFMNPDGTQNGPEAIRDGMSLTALFSEKLRGRFGNSSLDPRTDMIVGGRALPDSVEESRQACATQRGTPKGYSSQAGLCWMVGSLAHSNYNHTIEPNSTLPDCVLNLKITVNGLVGARSNHPGGVNVGMADGSVRYVKHTISSAVWRGLGTRAGGEIVSFDGL